MEYLPTKLGHFWGFYVGKYSSTMDPSWDKFPYVKQNDHPQSPGPKSGYTESTDCVTFTVHCINKHPMCLLLVMMVLDVQYHKFNLCVYLYIYISQKIGAKRPTLGLPGTSRFPNQPDTCLTTSGRPFAPSQLGFLTTGYPMSLMLPGTGNDLDTAGSMDVVAIDIYIYILHTDYINICAYTCIHTVLTSFQLTGPAIGFLRRGRPLPRRLSPSAAGLVGLVFSGSLSGGKSRLGMGPSGWMLYFVLHTYIYI